MNINKIINRMIRKKGRGGCGRSVVLVFVGSKAGARRLGEKEIMREKDTVIKEWLSDKGRFADLFNGVVFGGEQMIVPEDLEIIQGESNLWVPDKKGSGRAVQRYRDITMRWKGRMSFIVLASENQTKVHYAAPVRNMLYDSLSYTEQIERIWKEHLRKKDKATEAEYLSHFLKSDWIYPVVTLIFYYGEELWDGSLDLYGLFPDSMNDPGGEKIKKYIPNYRINLVDLYRIDNLECFHGDLQMIFGMVKYKEDRKRFLEYVQRHRNFFQKIEPETYRAICVLLNSPVKLDLREEQGDGKEKMDMCKALEELYQDGVEKGTERVNSLIKILGALGRVADIIRAAEDQEYQKQLFAEFGL